MVHWLTLILFKQKLPCLIIDFINIGLMYVYLQAYQHWSLNKEGKNIRVLAGPETMDMINQYMELRGLKPSSKVVDISE